MLIRTAVNYNQETYKWAYREPKLSDWLGDYANVKSIRNDYEWSLTRTERKLWFMSCVWEGEAKA